jgi:hypothetical protein
VPGKRFVIWKQDVPFTLQGCDSLLPRHTRLQEVERRVETAGDKGLEFGDPEVSLFLYDDFKTSCVSK